MTETVKKRKRSNCSIKVEENITESAPQGDSLNKELTVVKRSRYTFEEKKKILEECKTLNSRELCVKYGLNKSVLSKWRSNEEIIKNAAKTSRTKTLKKVSETNELDAKLFTWLSDRRCKGIPVSGPMLCRQALVINSRIGGPENFKASHGWLEKWKRRTDFECLEITGMKTGKLIIEGKTKQVYELVEDPTLCLLQSKDRITAGDGVKSHALEGKAAISTATTAKVFQLLNQAGLRTAFVEVVGETAFVAKKCEMVPIEWVTRRLATGSFLRRHPGVPEGYRFNPPLQETFFKDDANHDPQWSEQQIISTGFELNGLLIGKDEVDIMRRTTLTVFEVLERAWSTRDCALIDMKIEFGVDANGEIMVADIIDSDSWRLWPSGDKRLMKDKQVYRNLATVTDADLTTVKRNFEWVAEQLDYLVPPPSSLVVILMGSPSDEEHCKKIAKHAQALGLNAQLRVSSAHKATEETLRILAEYEGSGEKVVLIAVAGRSNGLGPVLSGNTPLPVINCPPVKPDNVMQDVWSSLNLPSGLGCTTVLYPESAALAAAQIHALHDHVVWSRLRVKQLTNFISLKQADAKLRNLTMSCDV